MSQLKQQKQAAYMPSATKQNKKLKFKAVRNTITLTRLDTLLTPLIHGLNIVLNDLKDKQTR
jgi:hypothetical protein